MKTFKKHSLLILVFLMLLNQTAFCKKVNYNDFSIIFNEQDERIEKILAKEIKLEILRIKKK